MFSYILVYGLGIATGAGLLIANKRCVDRAVTIEKNRSQQTIERIKREHIQVVRERDDLLREREWNQAYYEGRKSPLSDVERFADTLESHGAKFVNTSKQ